jgi:hypothetical protein
MVGRLLALFGQTEKGKNVLDFSELNFSFYGLMGSVTK